MKKSRYSESQIMAILKQAEGGVPVPAADGRTGSAKSRRQHRAGLPHVRLERDMLSL